jgi:two-component system cell cycle sensor histidine kinase/response regulator CckA
MAGPTLSTLWSELRAGPSLDAHVRVALAERVIRWTLPAGLFVLLSSVTSLLLTVGLSEPKRWVSCVLFGISLLLTYVLTRSQRFVTATATFGLTVFAAIAAGVLLNTVHAPIYAAGFVIMALVTPVFGARWGLLTLAGLVLVGLTSLVVPRTGFLLLAEQPSPLTRVCLYATYLSFALITHVKLEQLLTDALRTADYKQREAEAARAAEAATELAFHAVFDQVSTGMVLLTSGGEIAQINQRAVEWLGAQERGLIGMPLAAGGQWSNAQREILASAVAAAATGSSSQHEITVQGELGTQRVYQLRLSPFHDPQGALSHVLVEVVEITDLIDTRTLLTQARRLEALGKLSGGVAHDVNNMLSAIVGGSELVRAGQRRGEPHRIGAGLEVIDSSAQRAGALIKQLLTFGRQERSESIDIDVNELVLDMGKLFERTLHKSISIEITPAVETVHVRGDTAALQNALLNLALNAQDAMPDGGTFSISVDTRELSAEACGRLDAALEPGEVVVIRVSDTGSGMSAGVRGRMFEPFFTTKPLGQGTGLGLSAVHGTLRNHGGAIVVHTEEGVGSSFELILPALHVSRTPLRPSHQAPSAAAARLHARVLLADDEPLVRTTLTTMLSVAGCEVQAVENGNALLEALNEGATPDVIVTDLVMPGLNGIKLVQTIEATYACPLLLITGYTGEDLSDAVAGRSRQLLRKPFVQAS